MENLRREESWSAWSCGKMTAIETHPLCLAKTPLPSKAAVVSDSEMSEGKSKERYNTPPRRNCEAKENVSGASS